METGVWAANFFFDLSAVHEPDFNARIAWAIGVGLQSAKRGPTLGQLVSDLQHSAEPKVQLGSSLTLFPFKVDGVAAQTAAGLSTWLDSVSKSRNDFVGSPESRTDKRVFLQPTSSLQSCVEYLWHELLHLTVPFTHPARGGEKVDARYVDRDRWAGIMNKIGHEMPPELQDPLYPYKKEKVYLPMSAVGCATCSMFA